MERGKYVWSMEYEVEWRESRVREFGARNLKYLCRKKKRKKERKKPGRVADGKQNALKPDRKKGRKEVKNVG